MTKPANDVRPAKTQISLGIRPVWSESSLSALWVAKDPMILQVDNENRSDWADAQADLSLRWAQMPFCWLRREVVHMIIVIIRVICLRLSNAFCGSNFWGKMCVTEQYTISNT